MTDYVVRASCEPTRILSDNGIRKALALELIRITPAFDPVKDTKRIQPASLDVKLHCVDESAPINPRSGYSPFVPQGTEHTLRAGYISTIHLSELVDFGQFTPDRLRLLGVFSEARSSVRRLGGYMENHGAYFFSDQKRSHLELGNFGPNDIRCAPNDRIAQLFFTVIPYSEYLLGAGNTRAVHDYREKIQSLDTGTEVTSNEELRRLHKDGHLGVTPRLHTCNGAILVHAGDVAYRMRRVPDGIDFNKRDTYSREELLEPLFIKKGYTVKEGEHVIVETQEQFALSPHVGIRFWDNLHWSDFHNTRSMPSANIETVVGNLKMCTLTDGWIDPGYNGGFSRQPKWLTGRHIKTGDILGVGQVFHFPKGVGKEYGDAKLGSQYNKTQQTQFAK